MAKQYVLKKNIRYKKNIYMAIQYVLKKINGFFPCKVNLEIYRLL